MLEQAPHLEFDAASLRTLPIEDREPFAVAVTRVLDGVIVDALSPAQRFNLKKGSRGVEAGTIESSEEDDEDRIDQGYDVLSDSAVAISAVDVHEHSGGKYDDVASDSAVAIRAADGDGTRDWETTCNDTSLRGHL